MPEGNGEQQAPGFLERFGFESEDKAASAFESMKADLAKFKAESRGSKELADKLAALEAAEQARKDKELTETQRLAQKIAEMEKQMTERDALIAAKDRAILTERVFSSKLSGKTPEESAVLRRLLSSAVAGQVFADEAELVELLKPVEAEYDALRGKLGAGSGPGLTPTGAPRGTPAAGAAAKDFMNLTMAEKLRAFAGKK